MRHDKGRKKRGRIYVCTPCDNMMRRTSVVNGGWKEVGPSIWQAGERARETFLNGTCFAELIGITYIAQFEMDGGLVEGQEGPHIRKYSSQLH